MLAPSITAPAMADAAVIDHAVVSTVAYGDVFDYPLREFEVHRYLHGLRKVEKLDALLQGRTIGQLALQFILHEPSVPSILPNIYDEEGLDDFCAYDEAPALTDAEYDSIQALYARNFDLEAARA